MSDREEHGPGGPGGVGPGGPGGPGGHGGPGGPRGWHGPRHPALRVLRIVGMVILGVIGIGVFALAFGWLVMILWNWLMPGIFHLGTLTYWQAFGIVILAKLVFGGIGGPRRGPAGGPWGRGARGGNPWGGNPWEHRHEWHHHRDDWRWYREFWEQEGEPAFERFVEKKRAEQGPGAGGQGPGPSPQGA